MPHRLGSNRYGKSDVRLVQVRRGAGSDGVDQVVDLVVDITLEGDFTAAHTAGDNTRVVPTDTMRNTVYALARDHVFDTRGAEGFALRLAGHFLAAYPQVEAVTVGAVERPWQPLVAAGATQAHAFDGSSGERGTVRVEATRSAVTVFGGIDGLLLMKTADSGFSGFPRDRFTTLRETDDRLMVTVVRAEWRYGKDAPYALVRSRARDALLAAFAAHVSRSVQETLYAMGEAALDAASQIASIHLVLPNRHHLLADLAPFGMDNPNVVFVATDAPYGRIEATVERG